MYTNSVHLNNGIPYVYKPAAQPIKPKNTEHVGTTQAIYPVYTDIPYGIKPYTKIEEKTLPSGDILNTYKLINGQTITIIQKEGCPVVQTAFKVGAMDEPEGKDGMSHLMEHSMFHESEKYSDVDKEIKSLGGVSNASTDYSKTNYFIKLAKNDKETLGKAIDIEADMVFNPKFSKLEKEKKIVIKEAKECEASETKNISIKSVKDMFTLSKSSKNIIVGDETTVNSITEEDMFRYHGNYYIPSNSTTTIISPYHPDEIIDMAAKSFLEASAGIKNHPIKRTNYKLQDSLTRNDLISNENSKKDMVFEFCYPVSSVDDIAKINILTAWIKDNYNFSSGLYEIYDSKYEVYFENDIIDDEYDAFESLKEALNKISSGQISGEDLEKLKKDVIEEYDKTYKDNSDILSNVENSYLNFGHYTLEEIKNAIKNLTPEDIAEFSKFFSMSKCSMNVIHPKGTTNKEIEDSLNKYKNYITPVNLPKTTTQLDIRGNLKECNFHPCTSEKALTTTLPDNTNLTFINSKNDKCAILWEISNYNTSSFNPAAKFVLNEMINYIDTKQKDQYKNTSIRSASVFSNRNEFTFSSEFDFKDLDTVLDDMRRAFEINFNEKEFEKAKMMAKQTLINQSNNHSAFNMFLEEKLGQNSSLDKEKLLDSLDKLTLNDLKTYYNTILSNAHSNLFIDMPFEKNPESINKVASKAYIPNFTFRKDNTLRNVYQTSPKKCYIKSKNQPCYYKLHSFKTNGNQKDSMKFELLVKVLYERLFDSLREKQGLAYSLDTPFLEYGDMGIIALLINTDLKDKKDIEKIYSEFDKEVEKLKNEKITEKELEEAKNKLKMDILDSASDKSSFLECLAAQSTRPAGISRMENISETIDSINIDDIRNSANYTFKDKPDYLIEADNDTIDKNLDYFKTFGEIKRKN